jgi:hypothetical protein
VLRRETRVGTTHRLLLLVVTNSFESDGREFDSWDGLQDFLGSRFHERLCEARRASPVENMDLVIIHGGLMQLRIVNGVKVVKGQLITYSFWL